MLSFAQKVKNILDEQYFSMVVIILRKDASLSRNLALKMKNVLLEELFHMVPSRGSKNLPF